MTRRIQFEWEVPEEIFAQELWKDEKEAILEIKRSVVLELIRLKKISFRRGAELLNITYREFLDLMGEHKIPVLDYEEGWLEREMTDLKTLAQK